MITSTEGLQRPFDAKQEFTSDDWAGVREELNRSLGNASYITKADQVLTLDPQAEVSLSKEEAERMVAELRKKYSEEQPEYIFSEIRKLRAHFPSYGIDANPEDWEKIQFYVGDLRSQAEKFEREGDAETARMFFGMSVDAVAEMRATGNEDSPAYVDGEAKALHESLEKSRQEGDGYNFGIAAEKAQFAFSADPARRPTITEADWSSMRAALEHERATGNWNGFLPLAAAMQRLVATAAPVAE